MQKLNELKREQLEELIQDAKAELDNRLKPSYSKIVLDFENTDLNRMEISKKNGFDIATVNRALDRFRASFLLEHGVSGSWFNVELNGDVVIYPLQKPQDRSVKLNELIKTYTKRVTQ